MIYNVLSGTLSLYTTTTSCHKISVNGLSCGIRMRAQLSFVLSQITRLTDGQTDRQTDRILISRSHLHSMQRGNNGENLAKI